MISKTPTQTQTLLATKFLFRRLNGNKDIDTDNKGDHYLSVLSSNGKRISPEKNFYFRSPRVRPPCPFAVIGGKKNTGVSLQFYKHDYQISLVNSCNGLICLQDHVRDPNVIVWNPLTDDFKVLDCSSIKCPRSASNTHFDCVGFGLDPESKDYKVVVSVDDVYEYKDLDGMERYLGTETHYEVCSLKTGSWSPLRNPPYWFRGASIYMDGFLYLVANEWTSLYPTVILSFNIAKEEFSFFPLPETGKSMRSDTLSLVVYEGMLGCVLYLREGDEKNFEFWVREKDETWSKVTSYRVCGADKPLAYWSKGKWFFEGINHELLLFDSTTNEVEPLGIYDFPHTMQIVPFVESMTPVPSMEK